MVGWVVCWFVGGSELNSEELEGKATQRPQKGLKCWPFSDLSGNWDGTG